MACDTGMQRNPEEEFIHKIYSLMICTSMSA
jgi:hypothetical protein